ncbi:MAG: SDR family NAD(P)-dependent oxidoreductase [Firmicutes bacterium]|nr:SDR family NAD(P)-dependent oxidoreductase [Bacillota bacterium]
MNVLVTGATGFIGARLVEELLDRGYEVRVLIRKPIEQYQNIAWSKKVTSIPGDLRDRDSIKKAVRGADVVVHLAAQLGSWRAKPEDYTDVNYNGTRLLVEESEMAGVKHFLYISTAGVFGTLKQIPADETHPCNPRYPYEKTKFLAEQYIAKKIQDGFPATIIRPSHIYGPGDLNTVPLLKILQSVHLFPLIGGGRSFFQPLYIDDLLKGLMLIINNQKTVCGKLYVLAGKEFITFRSYIQLSSKLMGNKVLTPTFPYVLARFTAELNEVLAKLLNIEPVLTRFRVDFLGGHQFYSIKLAQHDFGFNPEVGLEQGIEKAINWYRYRKLI